MSFTVKLGDAELIFIGPAPRPFVFFGAFFRVGAFFFAAFFAVFFAAIVIASILPNSL